MGSCAVWRAAVSPDCCAAHRHGDGESMAVRPIGKGLLFMGMVAGATGIGGRARGRSYPEGREGKCAETMSGMTHFTAILIFMVRHLLVSAPVMRHQGGSWRPENGSPSTTQRLALEDNIDVHHPTGLYLAVAGCCSAYEQITGKSLRGSIHVRCKENEEHTHRLACSHDDAHVWLLFRT